MSDDIRALREQWQRAVRAANQAAAEAHKLDLAVAEFNAIHLVPGGYAVDYLGDGKIKLVGECARLPKE